MQISHFVALGTYYQQLSLPCTNQIVCLMSELIKRFMTGMYYLFSKQFTISPKFLKSCSFYKKRKVFIHVGFQRSIVTMIRYTDHKSTSNAATLKKKRILEKQRGSMVDSGTNLSSFLNHVYIFYHIFHFC